MKAIRIFFFILFFILNVAVILRAFGIAIFIGTKDIFWGVYICSLITWAILIYKKKKMIFVIIPLCVHGLIFGLALFRIGGLTNTAYITKIVSSSSNNTVIIKEFDRPIHSGCAIYKKCFFNVYYMTSLTDMETNYFPFSENIGVYEWNDENTIQLRFPYSRGSKNYKTITVEFD